VKLKNVKKLNSRLPNNELKIMRNCMNTEGVSGKSLKNVFVVPEAA
jgi:hypothetical protein